MIDIARAMPTEKDRKNVYFAGFFLKTDHLKEYFSVLLEEGEQDCLSGLQICMSELLHIP